MSVYFESPTLGRGKLVRDRVVEEIQARGGKEPIAFLPKEERLEALLVKLVEEATEALGALRLSDHRGTRLTSDATADAIGCELADVEDVARAVASELCINTDVYKLQKQARRGLFARFLFLRAQDLEAWRAKQSVDPTAETVPGLVSLGWKCACGWAGAHTDLIPNHGGSLVCPTCGASGGLVSDAGGET